MSDWVDARLKPRRAAVRKGMAALYALIASQHEGRSDRKYDVAGDDYELRSCSTEVDATVVALRKALLREIARTPAEDGYRKRTTDC